MKAIAQMGGLTREQVELHKRRLLWMMSGESVPPPDIKLTIQQEIALCDLALQVIDRWIPVGERLPHPKGPCVVLYGDNDHTTGSGVGIPFCASNPEYAHKHAIDHHYTHWLPLPPPPERP